MSKFYQISYGKTKENMGWHSFNIENDFPTKLISFFQTFANACAPGNFDYSRLKNADESYRDAFAIFSYAGNFGQTRIRYGFKETANQRDYMIATGFIAEIPKESDWEPDEIVSLSAENYNFVPSESFGIVEKIKRDIPREFNEIIEKYSLSQKTVSDIFRVVSLSMFEERNNATYFVCNSDDETVKDFIYLIYDLLPFELRHNVMFTNADLFNSPVCKMFKFIDAKPATGMYYDIRTGETNIAIERTSMYADRFPFVVAFSERDYEAYKKFCSDFSNAVTGYGFNRIAMTYRDLMIVNNLNEGSDALKYYNDEKLDMFVERLLFTKLPNNDKVNEYIYKALNILCERRIVPSDEAIEVIRTKSEQSGLEEFNSVALRLSLLNLMNGSENTLFKFLDEKQDTDDFIRIVEILISDHQVESIVKYYKSKIIHCTTSKDLKVLTEKMHKLSIFNEFKSDLLLKLEEICVLGVEKNLSVKNVAADTLSAVAKYCERFFVGEQNFMYKRIKNAFISRFNLNYFVFNETNIENTRLMFRGSDSKNHTLSMIIDIYCAINDYAATPNGKNIVHRIESTISKFFKAYPNEVRLAWEIFDYLIEKIKNIPKFNMSIAREIDEFIHIWFPVSYSLSFEVKDMSMVNLLLRANLRAFADDVVFESYTLPKLYSMGIYGCERFNESLLIYLSTESNEKNDNYKLVKKRAETMKQVLPKKEPKNKFLNFIKK